MATTRYAIQSSGYSISDYRLTIQIDWPAVATAMGINVSTARMRFRRLEDKIQGATNKTSGADKDVKMAGTPDGDGPVELPKEPEKKKTRLTKRKRTGKGAEDD